MGEVIRLPTPKIDICLKDGRPCHVGMNTEDEHWRCGTSACREPSPPPLTPHPKPLLGASRWGS